jgi:hypothetical protein
MIKKQIFDSNTMLTSSIILPELRVDSQAGFLILEALLWNLTGQAFEQLYSIKRMDNIFALLLNLAIENIIGACIQITGLFMVFSNSKPIGADISSAIIYFYSTPSKNSFVCLDFVFML